MKLWPPLTSYEAQVLLVLESRGDLKEPISSCLAEGRFLLAYRVPIPGVDCRCEGLSPTAPMLLTEWEKLYPQFRLKDGLKIICESCQTVDSLGQHDSTKMLVVSLDAAVDIQIVA